MAEISSSINILYTPNIDDVKKYNKYASPNSFVVSSYYNNGTYIGFDYYKGLSYELYYIDDNNKINQLTYNIVGGNGLNVKDDTFEIRIDDETLKQSNYNNGSYIFVNESKIKEASSLNRGLLYVDNNIYYNDNYNDINKDTGAFALSDYTITLSNGLLDDLNMINYYYKKCNKIIKKIESLYKLCIKGLNINTYIKVGDILYYNPSKKIYTLQEVNKNGTHNTPAMVCVIASNVLEDLEPRFMPIKRELNKFPFDTNNIIKLKNTKNSIPIYNTNDITEINMNTNIVGAKEGYIAIKRDSWLKNVKNPLNSSENYYTAKNKTIVFNVNEEIVNQNIMWYVDVNRIDVNNNYIILPGGIYTDIINKTIQNKLITDTIHITIVINFNNNLSKYYACTLTLNNNRYVNLNNIIGYDMLNTITSKIKDASKTLLENYEELNKVNKISNNISNNTNINFTSLKDISINFDDTNNTTIETVLLNNESIVNDTKIEIVNSVVTEHMYSFNLLANADGEVDIITERYLAVGTKLVNVFSIAKIIDTSCENYEGKCTNREKINITANTQSKTIYVININRDHTIGRVTATLHPFDSNKYKESSTSVKIELGVKHLSTTNNNQPATETIIKSSDIKKSDSKIIKAPTTQYISGGYSIYEDSSYNSWGT